MASIRADLGCRIPPEPIDHFDRLPDSLILLILYKIGDIKDLGRCCVVSRRFHALVHQVDNVTVRVDCVISDDDTSAADESRHPTCSLSRPFFSGLFKPLQSLSQLITHALRCTPLSEGLDCETEQNNITHYSPTQVLKNFNEIKILRIELPGGELGTNEGVFLRWKAEFGSTLDKCVILGASSIIQDVNGNRDISGAGSNNDNINNNNNGVENDNGSIPESFYTNVVTLLVWTMSSLIAASGRHYLLQPIITEHKTLESLVLTDADGQGVLSMNKEQLEELRVKPFTASSASKRTLIPALNMPMWYAPHLELPNGMALKGATLVAIRPSEQPKKGVMGPEGNWVPSSFEEPFGIAARMLLKRRTYCLEMNSF